LLLNHSGTDAKQKSSFSIPNQVTGQQQTSENRIAVQHKDIQYKKTKQKTIHNTTDNPTSSIATGKGFMTNAATVGLSMYHSSLLTMDDSRRNK
jgi:hypothetical protein